jgi:DegV family protein with EDD domain
MVKIITDTTSGLPLDQAAALDIPILPQMIVFGDESYRDDTEMNTYTFLQKLRSSPVLPKTAAPPPALFTPIFESLAEQGCAMICLHPSSELSGTVSSATVAAKELPEADICVIDTRTIAGPLATMVLEAVRWAEEGVDVDAIVARIRDMMSRQVIYFVVDTLEYLHRGGRIGGAKALLGGLLQIKPILTIKDGRVEPLEQQRTRRRARARVRELVLQGYPRAQGEHLCVMHADAEAEARALAGEFAEALGLSDVPIYELPPAIVVHGGPGILATSYFARTPVPELEESL